MLPRSNTRPVLTALGAATVITLGAVVLPATAFAADPAPTAGDSPAPDPSSTAPPSDPPSVPPPTPPVTKPPVTKPPYTPPPKTSPPGTSQPSLAVSLSLSASTVIPGGSVTAMVTMASRQAVAHHAVLRLSAPGASVTGPGEFGDLGAQRSASAVLTIPAGHGTGTINVIASLSADHASTRSASRKITVVALRAAGATGAAGAGGLPSGLSFPGVSAAAATALGLPDQAQLPLVAGQQPAVAPDALADVPNISLRSGASRLGLDETSFRLLWTQVAWLAALLVGVSLLLTQLRLKRRLPARTTARRSRRS